MAEMTRVKYSSLHLTTSHLPVFSQAGSCVLLIPQKDREAKGRHTLMRSTSNSFEDHYSLLVVFCVLSPLQLITQLAGFKQATQGGAVSVLLCSTMGLIICTTCI